MRVSRHRPDIKLVLKQVFHDPAAEEAGPAEYCNKPARGRNRLIVFRHELFLDYKRGSLRAIRCSLALSFPRSTASDTAHEAGREGAGGIEYNSPPRSTTEQREQHQESTGVGGLGSTPAARLIAARSACLAPRMPRAVTQDPPRFVIESKSLEFTESRINRHIGERLGHNAGLVWRISVSAAAIVKTSHPEPPPPDRGGRPGHVAEAALRK